MVSVQHLIFKSSSPCTNPVVTVPRASITFMFHGFYFYSQASSRIYPSFRFLSILLCGQQSPQFGKFSFFVVDY